LATSFSFDFNTARFKSTKDMDRRLQRAIFGVAKYWDGPIERYMKHNAPWKDRTTNARNGLFAKASKEAAGRFIILLAHSVSYGIYLERGTSKMRARPIILPTIGIYAPKVMGTLEKILSRLGRA
jgi:HK97 gp10 family phage protein